VRVLFFNEGNLGAHIMGQGQLDAALGVGAASVPDVEIHFAGLAPMGPLATRLVYQLAGPLGKVGLDISRLRWHLVQSARARRALDRALRSWPADVIQVHTQSVAMLMGKHKPALPLVLSIDTTVHDWWAMPAWRPSGRAAAAIFSPNVALERHAFRSAALTLAWTSWAARAVRRTAPGAAVVEHHPGIDLTRYRPAPHRDRERPRVLFVGGRFAEKGGGDLIDALAPELGREVDLDLVTPAPVPEREGVRVHRLGPSDPKLLDLQQQADLLCLPTYGDAAPWAIVEAMACATPVLSTHVGGIPDLLGDGEAGVLVPHGDVASLRSALQSLLGDAKRRASLGAVARARCEERYDARRQFSRLTSHLQAAIETTDG
jgi:glycosyltransferase involved in cell wall biosynthesis